MKKQPKPYKRLKTGIVTSATVVTIGVGMMAPMIVHAADGTLTHMHSSTQRKAPAWRVGLKAAEAEALGLTVDQFKEARRSKKLDQLVTEANLTPTQFSKKVKEALTTEWKSAGISDKEITSRLAKLDKFQDRREHRWEKHTLGV